MNKKIIVLLAFVLLVAAGVIIYLAVNNRSAKSGEDKNIDKLVDVEKDEAISCDTLPTFESPVKLADATSVLYPGQTRGGDYKPHGGFRFDRSTTNSVKVIAPLDAQVINGSRYIEGDEIQYLFTFRTACNIEYRFDHLKTLGTTLASAAEQLPEPKRDDSRTTELSGINVTAGEVIATEIGFSSPLNVSVDFGVYDMRNASGPDRLYKNYGLCWLEYLTEPDKSLAKSLPAGDGNNGKSSDYCK